MPDIRVNANKWNGLTDSHKARAIQVARENGWIGEQETLVPDESVPAPDWDRPDAPEKDRAANQGCYDACDDYGDVVYIACEPHDTAENCSQLAWDAVEQCVYENCT